MADRHNELRIGFCGGLAVELRGARIEEELPGRQGRELFAYLVLHRERPVSRDELLAVLWPDRAPRSPEAGLSTVLARLRRALGRELLSSGRTQLTLSLPESAWIDLEQARLAAARAETVLSSGGPSQALDIATEGLALLTAPPVPEFEAPWAQQAREHADELCSQLLELVALAGIRAGGNCLVDAERAARRLVERQPFRESGHALLMRALAARGDVAEGLRVYDQLRAALMDELGAVPSAQVVALHERLLRGRPAAADNADAGVALPPVLARNAAKAWVGRSSNLGELHEQWSSSASGACVVSLTGEPGIGKTMLAARFASEVHEQGATVLYGRADEEAVVPYSAFVEALRHYVIHTETGQLEEALGPHRNELGSLIAELAGTGSGPRATGDAELRRLHLFQAVAAMLADAAARHPTLLVLEDLHWADAGTLLMLRHVLRDTQHAPMLVVVTYRDVEMAPDSPLRPLVADLRRENDVARLALGGFDDEEIATLLCEAEQQPSPQLVRRLREHTSGNPLFMEEILRSARESQISLSELDASQLEQLEIPEGVQDVIRRRLSRLGAPTADALAAAAVLGRDFRLDALEATLGDGEDQAITAVDEALAARLVIEDPADAERYAFSHALVRDSIYRGLSRGRRARLHRRVALALESRRSILGIEAAELAHHFVQAAQADLADEAVAYSREAAARSLHGHAYEEAARHGRNALHALERHRPEDREARCETLLELGAVAWQASLPDARAISEQAVEAA
ncbi:MAG: AAA family ATPase, partial [Actinomycetota bacterium]|nr:AAA family ATPase [Actinomycetota bacterium]